MKKPDSMWGLYGELFSILGATFLLCGILAQTGVMKMKPGSHGDPRIFSIMGCVFLATGIFALCAAGAKEKREERLLRDGTSGRGTVVSVRQFSYTRFNHACAYVVHFTYEWEGEEYKGKSRLLWECPPVKKGDVLTVKIDEDAPKHCACLPGEARLTPPYRRD